MLTGCPTCTRVGEEAAERAAAADGGGAPVGVRLRLDAPTVVKVVAAGTAVGFFTGLFGVGGGFIIVPALTLLLAFPMPKAIGPSLPILATNCAWAPLARLRPVTGSGGNGLSETGVLGAFAIGVTDRLCNS